MPAADGETRTATEPGYSTAEEVAVAGLAVPEDRLSVFVAGTGPALVAGGIVGGLGLVDTTAPTSAGQERQVGSTTAQETSYPAQCLPVAVHLLLVPAATKALEVASESEPPEAAGVLGEVQ